MPHFPNWTPRSLRTVPPSAEQSSFPNKPTNNHNKTHKPPLDSKSSSCYHPILCISLKPNSKELYIHTALMSSLLILLSSLQPAFQIQLLPNYTTKISLVGANHQLLDLPTASDTPSFLNNFISCLSKHHTPLMVLLPHWLALFNLLCCIFLLSLYLKCCSTLGLYPWPFSLSTVIS